MAGHALIGCIPLAVTRDAVAHAQHDVPLRDGLLRDVTVTRRAFEVRANMRRMIESDVRRLRIPEDALPREINALLLHRRYTLDERFVDRNRRMADKARVDTGKTGRPPPRHAFVAHFRTTDALPGMNVVRELDGLHRRGPAPEEIPHRCRERRAGGCVNGGRMGTGGGRVRRRRHGRRAIVEPLAATQGGSGREESHAEEDVTAEPSRPAHPDRACLGPAPSQKRCHIRC